MYTLLVTGDVPGASTYFNPLVQQSIVPCTSGTRPTASHDGMTVWETDTNLHATWDGAAWIYPYSPDYTAFTPVFYSNAVSATAIAGGSVSLAYARYQKVNKKVHYYGSATINTTTASGFGFNLPANTSQRIFCMGQVYLHGATGYTDTFGNAFTPSISAPFNRLVVTAFTNGSRNIVTSGDSVHWNIVYESV